MKKKVYIISHSHWDREWYMPYEQHHMRLVELMDDVLELAENDPDFDSFHLDGQTIILDDYLQVRPEQKSAVQKAITAGKLRIGPFYILQDDFLISSESNVRNMLIGKKETDKWGSAVQLGYFPDTFGNMGQTPQMMQQAGLDAAAFGRGVKPVGFNNEVLDDENYTSQYSEMWWQGPDGSTVLGLLFANWYSNGNEIPAEKEAAIAFWTQKLAEAEKFASTNHLLMMNGVDHQPVQKNITKAIALANELFPEYEFIHSNFDEYLKQMQQDLPEKVGMVHGELTSQETDGWFTLANTASARVYLKQWNTKVERQLENITEPLVAMAYDLTQKYPHDQLDYAWKLLLQNHPHDSICGCSVDEVHREMMPRFEKANEVGKFLAEEALTHLVEAIDTEIFPETSHPFVVFNTSGYEKSEIVKVKVEIERKPFKEGTPHELWEALAESETPIFEVIDTHGQVIPASISTPEVHFGYDLPKDRFRIPYMAKYIDIEMRIANMPAFSWNTFALQETRSKAKENVSMIKDLKKYRLENSCLNVTINEDGTLAVLDKATGRIYNKLLTIENTGDIGNEYIFKQPEGARPILSSGCPAEISVIKDEAFMAQIKIIQRMMIPKSADDLLEKEQKAVVDFRYRNAGRSEKLQELTIETIVTMEKDSTHLRFETTLDNQMKDHRLRMLFPTGIQAETHEADSIYEVVTRPNQVSKSWENPTNPQHQHAFVNIHDDASGITVSNFGLNEYEILPETNTIALTLLRAVGEMGDWGYFPTPEAQCLGTHTFNYGVDFHGEKAQRYVTYQRAYAAQIPFSVKATSRHSGSLKAKDAYLMIAGETFAVTALKNSEDNRTLVVRGFNMSGKSAEVKIEKLDSNEPDLLNLLEEKQKEQIPKKMKAYEIHTIGFER
ncbi:alpha-mannosidase [Enterococcus caccae]|uniref:Glycosyl hydrolase n=1 Tax=Enterococcus caccae ATCC BAA-1240 TaxID=1158612 RepID=R3UAD7_9ENTE|nr:alpha-mannosidase [Enterococcus caccae]EOL50398.1 glycosyl hydrolase [Enterococcus caccae ATCC BAA-1240]EOT59165.1 glycosyl hydrolase [Enterococcus caccae ATCC BAA-1240]